MGALFDISQRVMREMEDRYPNPLDLIRAKGELARVSGFMVSMVGPDDMDDPVKIVNLRNAAHEIGIEI